MTLHTHSDKIERWLGTEQVELYSKMMKDWYGPPIAIKGVPGTVYAARGGDFVGHIDAGSSTSLIDYAEQKYRKVMRKWLDDNHRQLNAGFSSLSDLISEATSGGKSQFLMYQKTGTTPTTAGNSTTLWNIGNYPAAGGVGGTSGTGKVCNNSVTGAFKILNAAGGDTNHLVTWTSTATAASSLMLVDRLWDMTYNHATSTSTAVNSSNRPDRYQDANTAPGNFVCGSVTTALSATAHNITITYVDQDGNTAEAATAYAAPVSAVVNRSTLVAGNWFVPLNSGDSGARYLTNIAQSTITSVTGVSTWWIAHPLAFIPQPAANVPWILDGINSAFNLQRIYDNACLALYVPASPGSAVTYSGTIQTVSG